MPLYEYQCDDCGEPFEKMVRISEAANGQACPQCGSQQTHKQISTFASATKSSGASFTGASSSSCATGGSRFS